MKVKILGVNGSHRKNGNTKILVRLALEGAETMGDVETELIDLADTKINPCKACVRCMFEGTMEKPCVGWDDGMTQIYPKIAKADGIIIGSPVYMGTVSGKVKNFMDRLLPIYSTPWTENRGKLINKVGAAIAVGDSKHSGQETTQHTILDFFMICNSIPIGNGCEKPGGAYWGGATSLWPSLGNQGVLTKPDVYDRTIGLRTARGIGRRIAEIAKIVKAGIGALKEEEDRRIKAWSKSIPSGEIEIDWGKYYSITRTPPVEHIGINKFATGKRAFEFFLEEVSARKGAESFKKGLTMTSRGFDPDKVRKAMEKYGMILLSDDALYKLNPEFYGVWVKEK